MAVYFAVLKPGDKMLTMDLSHGGHLTHGNKANFSGKFFEIVHYGVRKEDERIDYDQLAAMAREHKPKMITVGASAYPRMIDFKRMGEIAREVGAYLLADIAHIAGLVATGIHPSPMAHADFVTTTTHKTLRGPRGGLILCREKYAKEIDSQVFPGIQGGPLEHVIAAKAVCFHEALQPSFKAYQQQIVKNAAALADGMKRNGYRLVSGGTDNHLMLVDVGAKGLTGKDCQIALDEAGITVNKNTIPFETRSPFQASGIRLGTPAVHHARHEGSGNGGHRRHDFRSADGHQKRRGRAQGPRPRARIDGEISAAVLICIESVPRRGTGVPRHSHASPFECGLSDGRKSRQTALDFLGRVCCECGPDGRRQPRGPDP